VQVSRAADPLWQGEGIGLLQTLSLQEFTFLGVLAFMQFLAHRAAQLPKFHISTKPVAERLGMAGTLLEWGQAEPWQPCLGSRAVCLAPSPRTSQGLYEKGGERVTFFIYYDNWLL